MDRLLKTLLLGLLLAALTSACGSTPIDEGETEDVAGVDSVTNGTDSADSADGAGDEIEDIEPASEPMLDALPEWMQEVLSLPPQSRGPQHDHDSHSHTLLDLTGPGRSEADGSDVAEPECGEFGALGIGFEPVEVTADIAEKVLVDLAFDPSGRGFAAAKDGGVWVLEGGALLPEPFVVVPDTSDVFIETGLLGVAVDPDFETHPWLYLFQSYVTTPGAPAAEGGCEELECPYALEEQPDGTTKVVDAPGMPSTFGNTRARIIRYDASANLAAGPDAFEVLADELPGGTATHNGGGLAFAFDGTLFVGLGDVTTPPNSQDFSNIVGCILRIDRHTGEAPEDNPFVAPDDGIPDRIWACGVRQGFGLAVHPDSGELYQSENGPAYGDEVNWVPKGGNLGWNVGAGFLNVDGLIDPVQTWTPNIAPVKLIAYAGDLLPNLHGDLLVASWNHGDVRRLHLADPLGDPGQLDWEGDFIPYVGKPVMLTQDSEGQIFVGDFLTGRILRIDAIDGCEAPVPAVKLDPSPALGVAPFTVTLDASESIVNPPATSLVKVFWDFGAEEGEAEGEVVEHEFQHIDVVEGTCTVVDNEGRHGQTTFTITVTAGQGDHYPSSHITLTHPSEGEAPLEVHFRGHGHDEEGVITTMTWSFGDGTEDLAFINPGSEVEVDFKHVFEEPGLYTVTLSVVDGAGQEATSFVMIDVIAP